MELNEWFDTIVSDIKKGKRAVNDYVRFNVCIAPSGELCADIADNLGQGYTALFIAYDAWFVICDWHDGYRVLSVCEHYELDEALREYAVENGLCV